MTFKPRLSKIGKAKLPLFLIAILLLLAFTINLLPNKRSQTKIRLTSSQNKFQVNFEITPQDLQKFDTFLEKLNIDKAIHDRLEFELDATSSAKLSLATPIEANLQFSKDEINFKGVANTAYLRQAPVYDVKIPKSTTLLVFSKTLGEIWAKNLKSPSFKEWLTKTISDNGQYFIIYGNDSQKAFIFNLQDVDFESLKNLKDIEYKKEESPEAFEYHILKTLPDSQNSETYVLTQQDDKIYLTLSLDSAKNLKKVLTENEDSTKYPNNNLKEATLTVMFLNEFPLSDEFTKSVFGDASKIGKNLTKISRFELVLKDETFSGLISIK